MNFKQILLGQTFTFDSVKEVLAKGGEHKSGDVLAGIAAKSDIERISAKEVLASMMLKTLYENPVVSYENDEVTRINIDGLDQDIYRKIQNWTVSDLREWILSYQTTGKDMEQISKGLTAEMISAVCKIMTNLDLVYAAKKINVTATCNTTVGESGIMGTRLQPNHTTDNIEGITASVLEGLSYGCGDVLIGLNPVNDSVSSMTEVLKRLDELKNSMEIPTQICVLGHINDQIEAVKKGAPCDMIFQSIAGSEKGNRAFGFSADNVYEAQNLMRSQGTAKGPNVLYFETGQGSELSSSAHFGADQVTMEARCYAFARPFKPFMVNTVVGFIGPEYLYDSKQVIRAGLEDHFMAKLSGLPMGCDCCYTNHMNADQNDIENLALLLGAAGVNYILGVPSGDDIMLNYQTNAYHDINAIREILGLRPIPAFEKWLERHEIMEHGKLTKYAGDAVRLMKKGNM